ncbi:MAG TPA: DUF4347 domain-containing protein, partial [Burkholderiales bacterium]|nr:DUF4347 domain-containing protein [Burkholderiales bacterium]
MADNIPREIAFIDSAISDINVFLAGLRPEIQAIILDDSEPAVAQMARAIHSRSDIDAVHLVAHGSSGSIDFSAGALCVETIEREAEGLRAIGRALADEGALLLWTCRSGSGDRGSAFVDELSGLTGARVAAATGLIGSARHGASWNLDHAPESYRASPPLTATGAALYAGVMAVITGTPDPDVLNDTIEDDTIDGLEGDDVMTVTVGLDSAAGGIGTDHLIVNYASATSSITGATSSGDLATGYAGSFGTTGRSVSFTGIEHFIIDTGSGNDSITTGDGSDVIRSGAGDDTLIGHGGNDALDGGEGNDVMLGGSGDDAYGVSAAGDVVTEAAGEGTDTVLSSITYTLGANLENLILTGAAANGTGNIENNTISGNELANTLNGAGANDTLFGLGGNDTLNGSTGDDLMAGGLGNDSYAVDAAGDVVVEVAGEGTDTVFSSVTYTLVDEVEHLTLTGAAPIDGTGNTANNTITGNEMVNTLIGGGGNDTLFGRGGDDVINGGTGNDVMVGGQGDDAYAVDSGSDQIVEVAGQGNDTVFSAITYILSANLENLTLNGAAAVNGTGNTDNNTISGNEAANVLNGAGGNDLLFGNDGNDTLNGSTGDDVMAGGLGDDSYSVDSTGDSVLEGAGQGTDTVFSAVTYTLLEDVEHLTLNEGAAIDGTGNSGDNTITGNDLVNTLTGGAGNDTLFGRAGNDVLNGGTGTDMMAGGLGDDWYAVDSASDTIVEVAGEGS